MNRNQIIIKIIINLLIQEPNPTILVPDLKRIHWSDSANITTYPDSLEFICYQAVQGEQMRSQSQW